MNYHVFRLLRREESEQVLREVMRAVFVDGKRTAAGLAKAVKSNLQADRGQPVPAAEQTIRKALEAHAEFAGFAQPATVLPAIYSRYEPGMEYGAHVDSAIMGQPGSPRIRSDLSMTLFLSPPESYDGGELVIHGPAGREEVKLDAGEAVVYPSTNIHHVAPVTRGVRMAAVTWIQSLVRNEALRASLFDLWKASQRASARNDADLELLLSKIYNNLIRYAAEP